MPSDEDLDGLKLEAPAGQALVIRPGDVLVLRYDQAVIMSDAEVVKERIMAKLPGLADVLILNRVQEIAVYRPEE